jgi:hypothetical protein
MSEPASKVLNVRSWRLADKSIGVDAATLTQQCASLPRVSISLIELPQISSDRDAVVKGHDRDYSDPSKRRQHEPGKQLFHQYFIRASCTPRLVGTGQKFGI